MRAHSNDENNHDTNSATKKILKNKLLFEYARQGSDTNVINYLNAGAKINYIDNDTGKSSLHAAVDGKHVDVINVLRQRGADMNILDRKGLPPAYYAAKSCNPRVIGAMESGNPNIMKPYAEMVALPQELEIIKRMGVAKNEATKGILGSHLNKVIESRASGAQNIAPSTL